MPNTNLDFASGFTRGLANAIQQRRQADLQKQAQQTKLAQTMFESIKDQIGNINELPPQYVNVLMGLPADYKPKGKNGPDPVGIATGVINKAIENHKAQNGGIGTPGAAPSDSAAAQAPSAPSPTTPTSPAPGAMGTASFAPGAATPTKPSPLSFLSGSAPSAAPSAPETAPAASPAAPASAPPSGSMFQTPYGGIHLMTPEEQAVRSANANMAVSEAQMNAARRYLPQMQKDQPGANLWDALAFVTNGKFDLRKAGLAGRLQAKMGIDPNDPTKTPRMFDFDPMSGAYLRPGTNEVVPDIQAVTSGAGTPNLQHVFMVDPSDPSKTVRAYNFNPKATNGDNYTDPDTGKVVHGLIQPPSAGERTAALGTLSGAALDIAAQKYHDTGELPAMGMGGMAARAAILNRHAEMYPNDRLSANTAQYKANVSALTKLTGTVNALEAFSGGAKRNIQAFLDMANKVVDTGSPWLNLPVRAVTKNLIGDPALADFEIARNRAMTEFARATSNPNLTGQLSVSAQEEMNKLGSGDYSLPQYVAVASRMLQDMDNMHAGISNQVQDLQTRLGVNQPSNASAKPPANPVPAQLWNSPQYGPRKWDAQQKLWVPTTPAQ